MDKFNQHTNKLVFQFDTQEAAIHFKTWLCEQGEQDYFTWMEMREQEETGPITGIDFDYHSGNETIPVKCGRLDGDT